MADTYADGPFCMSGSDCCASGYEDRTDGCCVRSVDGGMRTVNDGTRTIGEESRTAEGRGMRTMEVGMRALDGCVRTVDRSPDSRAGPEEQPTAATTTVMLPRLDVADSGFMNACDYTDTFADEINCPSEPRMLNPQSYSPIIYALNQPKYDTNIHLTYAADMTRTLPVGGSRASQKKTRTLPYLFVNKDSITDITFGVYQSKLRLYNYWITTDDAARVKTAIINMFGADDIYVTKSFFFKKSNSYSGQRIILITQIPQRPYKFINKLNRKMARDKRTVKSVNGDYLISCDCVVIILSTYSIDYICSNYYKYHKNEATQIETLMTSLKSKFTCADGKDLFA